MTDRYDPRYPIGHFEPAVTYSAGARNESIEALRSLPVRLIDAVAGLNTEQLDTSYREGGWTVRQLVHHVADSHSNAYIRFKLALTENWPTIKPYDEAAWAELADSRLPIDVSLSMTSAIHSRWVALLESMTEADFARGYSHPERGRQDLATVLALYDWHSRHHTAHITRLRERMGW